MAGCSLDQRAFVKGVRSSSQTHGNSSNVYVFHNSEIFEEEINTETNSDYTFRPRHKRPSPKKSETLFVEVKICDGDTLLSIALKYSCQVN